jgi:fructosamine-3-kinase
VEKLPPEVLDWLQSRGEGKPVSFQSVSGGCIHQARILKTETGRGFFLKTNDSAPPNIFIREAEGLRALCIPGGPTVPDVFLAGDNFLLLEDLKPAPRRKDFWEIYGRQLAVLHSQSNSGFGFPHDNYIGSTPQDNGWMEDGIDFFRERRLTPQIRLAADRGYLSPEDRKLCDSLLAKLPGLLPGSPPVLVHGDLWGGNLITDSAGGPALIDPAVYFGWAEADLAMTDLFGRYPEAFYASYAANNPLPKGFRERFPIYNLYHLLNHLNIFGREYLSRVRKVLLRYS